MNPLILTTGAIASVRNAWRDVYGDADEAGVVDAALQAMATGRTVVVPVMTEAQAREAFEVWAKTECPTTNCHRTPHGDYYVIGLERDWRAWTAALRHAGVLK